MLKEMLMNLSTRLPDLQPALGTEEASKHSLVLPFIAALGYNTYDPFEVIPEFTADVGGRKAEKVDYAIQKDKEPMILIECKAVNSKLDIKHAQQLFRYFTATNARFAILTNGIHYKFFTDIEDANKMDETPFFEFTLDKLNEHVFSELQKFTKEKFDLENILGTAEKLKYQSLLKQAFAEEYESPSEDFVKLFAKKVYDGMLNNKAKDKFDDLVKMAFRDFISDRISSRLQSVIESDSENSSASETDDDDDEYVKDGVITTKEEKEGFSVIQAIASEVVDSGRITMRDTKSYCGVLLDDNNRRQICRMLFDLKQKRIEITREDGKVIKHGIDLPSDIYKYGKDIRERVREIESNI